MLSFLAIFLAQSSPKGSISDQSFRKVYRDYFGLVDFVVKQFKFPAQVSEEIVQEVFMKYFENHQQVKPETLKPYLTTMSRNLCIDYFRKVKRQKTEAVGEEWGDHNEELWRNDPRRIVEAEAVHEFFEQIKEEPGADVLIEFYSKGKSVKEIAESRGEKVGSITSRLSRARQKFKEQLHHHLDRMIYPGASIHE